MRRVFLVILVLISSLSVVLAAVSLDSGNEVASPGDWIKEDQIKVFSDQVILDLTGASWAKFTDSNSMDPFLDVGANAIEVKPENPADISVGDVISYYSGNRIIVHRVVEIGNDGDWYYVVKGDNNNFKDNVKVRFDDIFGVVVAIIY